MSGVVVLRHRVVSVDAPHTDLLVTNFAFVYNRAYIYMAVRSTLDSLFVLIDLVHLLLNIPLVNMRGHLQ